MTHCWIKTLVMINISIKVCHTQITHQEPHLSQLRAESLCVELFSTDLYCVRETVDDECYVKWGDVTWWHPVMPHCSGHLQPGAVSYPYTYLIISNFRNRSGWKGESNHQFIHTTTHILQFGWKFWYVVGYISWVVVKILLHIIFYNFVAAFKG